MKKENPDKEFIPLPSNDGCACNECPHMRLNTLEKLYNSLENMQSKIEIDERTLMKAVK